MNIRTSVVALSLLTSSFFSATPVFAATSSQPSVMMEKTTTTTTTTSATGEEMMKTTVEYTLPYPGILPDHPLYFLKKLRDQLMEKLIADPVKKIEFFMLQADKSINMAVFLLAKQNEPRMKEVLSWTQSYFEKAVDAAVTLKQQGKEVPPALVDRFTNAGAKYKEVLTELSLQVSEAQKEGIVSLIASLDALQEKVAQLK